jgi:hypothetical protein
MKQSRELRECLECDRGYPRALRPESAGRIDAEDRGTPETARLDTGGSGEPLRGNAAPDRRSAPRPSFALLARRAGQHRDGARLPRARRSRSRLSRVLFLETLGRLCEMPVDGSSPKADDKKRSSAPRSYWNNCGNSRLLRAALGLAQQGAAVLSPLLDCEGSKPGLVFIPIVAQPASDDRGQTRVSMTAKL